MSNGGGMFIPRGMSEEHLEPFMFLIEGGLGSDQIASKLTLDQQRLIVSNIGGYRLFATNYLYDGYPGIHPDSVADQQIGEC